MSANISDSIFTLSKMGLNSLQHEPQRLMTEATRLNGELEVLVMENYKIFVENLSCSVQLRAEDQHLDEVRKNLAHNLHELSDTCKIFRENVTNIINSHKRNRKTLQHHMQLVELLEVPQLVDACARNGFYDEALELANFVNGLERRHLLASEVQIANNKTPSSPKQSKSIGSSISNRAGSNVVQSIVDDVYKTLLTLRSQLLQLLTEDSSLPQELHILGTLRKLDSLMIDRQLSLERYNNDKFMQLSDSQREDIRRHMLKGAESRLQMSFLEARSLWLKKLFDRSTGLNMTATSTTTTGSTADASSSSITSGDHLGPYGKAIEMLEVNRTAWFSIITQYNALFADHKDGPSAGAHPTDAVLNAWVTRQVDKLLQSLKLFLPQIEEGGSIRSIFEQTMFFSSRMREVGGDFTGLAMPLFTDVITQRVTNEWKAAYEQFQRIIETEKVVIDADEYAREQMVPLYLSQEESVSDTISSNQPNAKKSYEDIPAPVALLAYPPLAYLLNAILSGLNIVRECPLPTVKANLIYELEVLSRAMVTYLIKQAKYLASKSSKYLSSMSSTSRPASSYAAVTSNQAAKSSTSSLDKLYASAFTLNFLPHVLLCIETLFPRSKAGGAVDSNPRSYTSSDLMNMFGGSLLIQRGIEHRDMIGKELFTIQQHALDNLLDADLLAKELKYSHSSHVHVSTSKTTAVPNSSATTQLPVAAIQPPDISSTTTTAVDDAVAIDSAAPLISEVVEEVVPKSITMQAIATDINDKDPDNV